MFVEATLLYQQTAKQINKRTIPIRHVPKLNEVGKRASKQHRPTHSLSWATVGPTEHFTVSRIYTFPETIFVPTSIPKLGTTEGIWNVTT
jgi:hypothetical protein